MTFDRATSSYLMHPDVLRGNIKPLDKASIGMWALGSMRRDLRVNKRAVFANCDCYQIWPAGGRWKMIFEGLVFQ